MNVQVVSTRNGQSFQRMRCSTKEANTRCYITYSAERGAEELHQYLRTASRELHNFYKYTTLTGYLCFCGKSLILKMSQSANNPGRLYFSCPLNVCKFFQWGDQPPTEQNRHWLLHKSRDRDGYPKKGVDEVPVYTQPQCTYPTDEGLWDKCKIEPILLEDGGSNKILFPKEVAGFTYDKTKDLQYRQKIYHRRCLTNLNRQLFNDQTIDLPREIWEQVMQTPLVLDINGSIATPEEIKGLPYSPQEEPALREKLYKAVLDKRLQEIRAESSNTSVLQEGEA